MRETWLKCDPIIFAYCNVPKKQCEKWMIKKISRFSVRNGIRGSSFDFNFKLHSVATGAYERPNSIRSECDPALRSMRQHPVSGSRGHRKSFDVRRAKRFAIKMHTYWRCLLNKKRQQSTCILYWSSSSTASAVSLALAAFFLLQFHLLYPPTTCPHPYKAFNPINVSIHNFASNLNSLYW